MSTIKHSFLLYLFILSIFIQSVFTWPTSRKEEDLTQYVDLFVGTYRNHTSGNVFPGPSVPFGMSKPGFDVNIFIQSGYYSNPEDNVTSLSLLHNSGTGGDESYGNYGSLPIFCPNDKITMCGVTKTQRTKQRKMNGKDVADVAKPGYFKSILNDSTVLEVTATRRASLIRYTYPKSHSKPFITFDWTEAKASGTFKGIGNVKLVKGKDGRMTQLLLNGTFASSFSEPFFQNNVHACFDLNAKGDQCVDEFAMWSANETDQDVQFTLNKDYDEANYPGQSGRTKGVVIGYNKTKHYHGQAQVLLRAGVSFVSPEQACQNAQDEIPDYDFAKIVSQSKQLWNEKLSRIQLDSKTDIKTKRLLYTSLYRTFLTPDNATGEASGPFLGNPAPYYDALYCSWDTFRTFYPLLSLTSPQEYADISKNYLESSKVVGYIPDCRANNDPGIQQGGSDGTNILADFAVKYRNVDLGVNMEELYAALYHDATYNSKMFDWGGRQIAVYEKYGYIPVDYNETGILDANETGVTYGLQLDQVSRSVEYVYNDFGIRNVAIMLNKTEDVERLTNRSFFYRNLYDKNVTSMGFSTFMQKRLMNGSFEEADPITCSPLDMTPHRPCGLGSLNTFGFFESSSWEYSFDVQHDLAGLIQLISNGSNSNYMDRVDMYYDKQLDWLGNEPNFHIPITYHYANSPVRSVNRVRDTVLNTFNMTRLGMPGADDSGAMAALLIFHMLGLYPIPSTREYLVVSPSIECYTLFNDAFGSVRFSTKGFDSRSSEYSKPIPDDVKAYVKVVWINGKRQSSRCKIEFDQMFPAAATKHPKHQHTEIVFEMGTRDEVQDCGPSPNDLPSSLSTGGFASF